MKIIHIWYAMFVWKHVHTEFLYSYYIILPGTFMLWRPINIPGIYTPIICLAFLELNLTLSLCNLWARVRRKLIDWYMYVIFANAVLIFSSPEPKAPKGGNYEKLKIHWRNFKIFFSRTTGPISTKFGIKHPWVKGIQVCSN